MKQIFLVIFLTANILHAQKLVKKSITNPEIEAINLDVTNSFELTVDTVLGDEIMVEASIDGEYSNDVLVNIRESGNTLLVNTEFQPNFKNPNDKLSAHKVISIALKVLLPERKRVTIFGTGCNVTVKGTFGKLKITLNDGRCHLENISGIADIATQSGNISIAAANGEIMATTKYGKVAQNPIPSGETIYNLSSITGNILLKKIE